MAKTTKTRTQPPRSRLAAATDEEEEDTPIQQSTADFLRETPIAEDNRPQAARDQGPPSTYRVDPEAYTQQYRREMDRFRADPLGQRTEETRFVVNTRSVGRIDTKQAVRVITVRSGPEKGLLRTEGLRHYAMPELVIAQGAPLFALPYLTTILYEVAELMLNGTQRVYPGARVTVDAARFTLRTVTYQGRDHYELSDSEDYLSYGRPRTGEYYPSYAEGAACSSGGCRPASAKFDF
jgi:hypothetical protein